MDKFVIYIILLAVVCIKGAVGKNRDEPEPKIVGGNETTIEIYPYQVFLLVYDGTNYYQCGGSIISEHYVLTAAHCLKGMKEVNIRIGSTTSNSGGNVYKTPTFYIHPLYDNKTTDYDAGVVEVKAGMKLDGTKAKAIKMVNIGYDPSENVNMTITGWGTTKENGSTSLILRETQVPVVSRSRCNKMVGGGVTNRMFCAGFLEGGKDTCQGDSGGPAVAESINRLAGITSHGYGCARPNFPGIYTLVGNIQVRLFITVITLL